MQSSISLKFDNNFEGYKYPFLNKNETILIIQYIIVKSLNTLTSKNSVTRLIDSCLLNIY